MRVQMRVRREVVQVPCRHAPGLAFTRQQARAPWPEAHRDGRHRRAVPCHALAGVQTAEPPAWPMLTRLTRHTASVTRTRFGRPMTTATATCEVCVNCHK